MDLNIDAYLIIDILVYLLIASSTIKTLTIAIQKEQRHRLSDPLYVIIMGAILCITIFISIYNPIPLLYILAILAFVNWALLRFTDEDYDMEKDAKNALRVMKKCPYCAKDLPSYLTKKCPHCTADL